MLCADLGWTIKDIGNLTYEQLNMYLKCMVKRFEIMNGSSSKTGITTSISGNKKIISNKLV